MRQDTIHVHGPFPVGRLKPRHVRVYVPRRAASNDHPALLMFDGQNVFDDKPSFAGGWHAHLAVERLAKTVRAPLLVGIDHGHEQRINELSPFSFLRFQGQLDELLDWVEGFLSPWLVETYGATRSPARRTLAGSSMGGIAALYAGLTRPQLASGVLAMSPSLWIAERRIFELLAKRHLSTESRVYLDGGAREDRGRVLHDAGSMAALLSERGVRDLHFRADPRGGHNERSWRRRLLPALRFHFGSSRSPRS